MQRSNQGCSLFSDRQNGPWHESIDFLSKARKKWHLPKNNFGKARCQSSQGQRRVTQSEETKTKNVTRLHARQRRTNAKKVLQMRLNFNWASFFLFYMFNIQLTTNFRTFFRMQDKVSLLHKLYIISVPKRNFFRLRLCTS